MRLCNNRAVEPEFKFQRRSPKPNMEDTMTCMPCAHVVVLKTDGTEGGKYPLHEDAMIGRYAVANGCDNFLWPPS